MYFSVAVFDETEFGAGTPAFVPDEVYGEREFVLPVIVDEFNQRVPRNS
jgi:hypothetical protein